MCGLAGFFNANAQAREAHEAAVARMIAPIHHRGPDDHGIWVEPTAGVGLGFRRLAIIDLSERGHQPMHSASGRFTMAFNGEVYNFAELREELASRGARFRGHSDTEVMLAAFEAWGVAAALPRFVGMFAIAAWDAKERCLHLARDRFGKKPLFVASGAGFTSFGSEIKALTAGPAFDRTIDRASLAAYLRYLYVPAPWTIHRGVRKLPPGHLLTIRDASRPPGESRAFWSLEEVVRRGAAEPFTGSDAEAIDEAERLIGEAASQRMVADVPLGAFLSGGIDSSTVVALMQERSPRPVRTFSVGFDDAAYDESAHAAAVAKHLGTSHSSVRLTGDDALRLVPELPNWFDEPLADPSQLPTYLICREARREVTVAVSGDGGDEVFGGYNRYLQGERLLDLGRRLGPIGPVAARGAALLLRGIGRSRGAAEQVQKVLQALAAGPAPAAMYRSLLSAAFQDPSRLVRGAEERRDAVDLAFANGALRAPMERMQLADQLEYLPDDLLAKVDRVSMAVSLEVRVPLLDHRVAEFGWRLPRRFKVRGGETKWILRQLLYRRVPRELVDRPKMGFSVPIDRWLRGPLREWTSDLFSEAALARSDVFDREEVQRTWKAFLAGDGRVSGMGIWTLVNFQAWSQRWT